MSRSSSTGIGCGGAILVLVVLAIVGLIDMVLGAVGIGAANAWFFAGNFSDGWSAAWAKPWVLLGWTVLFYGVVAGIVSGRRD